MNPKNIRRIITGADTKSIVDTIRGAAATDVDPEAAAELTRIADGLDAAFAGIDEALRELGE